MNPFRYVYPSLDLLRAPEEASALFNDLQDAANIQAKLLGMGISASVKKISRGPQAAQYALLIEPIVNVNVLANRKSIIAGKLGVKTVRLEIPIPGTSLIGLQVPNKTAAPVSLQELLPCTIGCGDDSFTKIPLGKDLKGQAVYCEISDLGKFLLLVEK